MFVNKNKLCRAQWGGNGLKSGQYNGSNSTIISLHIASIFQTDACDMHLRLFAIFNLRRKTINEVLKKFKTSLNRWHG